MDADRWRRIETIFAAAVDLPVVEREAFLAARCADPELVKEVRALLAADARAASVVDKPALAGAIAEPTDKILGQVLDGRYRTVALLGRGGMGAVYEAVHTGTSRRVAIKVISPEVVASREVLRRFQLEARAAGRLESPHVAQVLDVGFDEGTQAPYLAIEFLRGSDVAQLASERGALEPTVAMRIVAQACRGLEAAHAEGIIHRDIKPANLFLARGPDDTRVLKILDFGIAKLQHEDLSAGSAITKTGTIIGSPLYMSPEQALGERELDHRTDLWSLGVVLFELLTGGTPFDRRAPLASMLVSVTSAAIPSVRDRAPWVSSAVAEIVDRLLQRDRARRTASARELLAALRALLPSGLEIGESDLTLPSRSAAASPAGAPCDPAAATEVAVASTMPLPVAHPSRPAEADETGVSGAATVSETPEEPARVSRGRWMVASAIALSGAVLVGALAKLKGAGDELRGSTASAVTASITADETISARAATDVARPTPCAKAAESSLVVPRPSSTPPEASAVAPRTAPPAASASAARRVPSSHPSPPSGPTNDPLANP